MPFYLCRNCGKVVEKPPGTYYCSVCGPEYILEETIITPRDIEFGKVCQRLLLGLEEFVRRNRETLDKLKEWDPETYEDIMRIKSHLWANTWAVRAIEEKQKR